MTDRVAEQTPSPSTSEPSGERVTEVMSLLHAVDRGDADAAYRVRAFLHRWTQTQPPPSKPGEATDVMPVFVLKAKDNLALAAIRAYKDECVAYQLLPQAAEVVKAMREIEAWRSRNGDKLKYPDHSHVAAGHPGSGSEAARRPTAPATAEPTRRELAEEILRRFRAKQEVKPPAEPSPAELPDWITDVLDKSYDAEGEIVYSVNRYGPDAAGNPRFHLSMAELKCALAVVRDRLTPAADAELRRRCDLEDVIGVPFDRAEHAYSTAHGKRPESTAACYAWVIGEWEAAKRLLDSHAPDGHNVTNSQFAELRRRCEELQDANRELVAENHALERRCEAAEAKADAEMLRVKACEYIAEGELDWERLRNQCPSTMAVAALRDALTAAEAALAAERAERERVEVERDELRAIGAKYYQAASDLESLAAERAAAEGRAEAMAKALEALGKERQFAGELCFCNTAAGLYCVGQQQCEEARAALALQPVHQPAASGGGAPDGQT